MSRASTLFQLCQIASANLLLRSSKCSRGSYMVRWKHYPILYVCRAVQTTTYEVVNGSYVPTAQNQQVKELKGVKKIEEVFKHEAKAIDDLLHIAKTLRAMPVVDLETPTLCLVGAPNVGKVIFGPHTRYRKAREDRNNLEKLTLAVLSHLRTAILCVHDLSGECGTSRSDQCDLLEKSPVVFITEDENLDHVELTSYWKLGPDGAIHVSIKSEAGLSELKVRVHELLASQMAKIRSQKDKEEDLVST